MLWSLEPFRRVILDLKVKDHPTLPLVVPCIWYLRDELKTVPIDSSILRYLKEKSLAILGQKIELKDIHYAAAIVVVMIKMKKILIICPDMRIIHARTLRKQDELSQYLKFEHH